MLWKMYVKEVRQFIRRPFNIVFMLAAPVFLILLMGYAMSGIIGTTEAENNTKTAMDNGRIVLYLVEEGADSHYQRKFSEFKDYVETGMNIPFEAADSSEDGCQQVDMQKAAALIKVSEEGFYYYRSPYNEPQISKMIRSAYNILLASEYGQSHSYISTREVRQKQINSYTYFTFAELGLIMLYLSLITGQSVFREKDTGTFERICISKASSGKMLLSKIALGCTVGALQIILVYIISGSVLNVEWGSKYILIFVLYMFLALFSSTMGAVAGLLSKKKASLNDKLLILAIFFGLLGGGLTPLSFLDSVKVVSTLCKVSPLYWITNSAIALSYGKLSREYAFGAAMCLMLAAFMACIYLFIRRREKARGISVYE